MSKATPTPVYFEAEAIRNAREYAGDAARRAKEKDTQIEAQAAEITRLRAERDILHARNSRLWEGLDMAKTMLQTGMPEYDANDALGVISAALGETQ